MGVAPFADWFEEWPQSGLRYDERAPRAVWPIMGVLAVAGAAALVGDSAGFWRRAVWPERLAELTSLPVTVALMLLAKWLFHDEARHVPAIVAADHLASAGAASLLAPRLFADPRAATQWFLAFVLLSLLAGTFLHGRGWAQLFWYASVQRFVSERSAEIRAVLEQPATGHDFVVTVTAVHGDRVDIELRDSTGTRPARTAPAVLGSSARARTRYLVTGAEVTTEVNPVPAGGYRSARESLRLASTQTCQNIGAGEPGSVSFVPEMAVSVFMLLLQHALIGLVAVWAGTM